jgi:VIT1/CCC1 family predicted Fe2+/Mn2+ transporter
VKLEHAHDPDSIRRRLADGPGPSYLRDWIYGGIDGAVTTFAIVSGVVSAQLSTAVVVVLGLVNLLADGFSMAAGNYSGTKAELDLRDHLAAMERRHIEHDPRGEREEIRQIFARKGFTGDLLERIVSVITGERSRWVKTMLAEEHGLPMRDRRPIRAALSTFSAFLVCGSAPLAPYLLSFGRPFVWSTVLTAAVFFAIGSVQSRWSTYPWWKTGLGTLAIGAVAAGLAFGVGRLLHGLGVS